MIKDFNKFLNEKAKIEIEGLDNTSGMDFTLIPIKETVTVVSIKGTFDDDTLDLTYIMSDGNEIRFDGHFFVGPPSEYHLAKGEKEHVRISTNNSKTSYDIEPDYYISLLQDWGEDSIFSILINELFYDEMKLQGFKSTPKLDWRKIEKK